MARKQPIAAPARAEELAPAAALAGARWVTLERQALHAEGRRAEGGWPGRLSQAKDWVQAALGGSSQKLTHEEATWMAQAIYDCARRDWLARQDPPDPSQRLD